MQNEEPVLRYGTTVPHDAGRESGHIPGIRFQCPVSRSNRSAARNRARSEKCGPMIWSDSGRPSEEKPDGTAMAGMPTRLAGAVKMSERYIDSGSSVFAPMANAGSGVVGVR